MKTGAELMTEVHADDKVTNLLVRYWGIGQTLNDEERELLLIALDEENKALQGPIHQRALERLKELGIE